MINDAIRRRVEGHRAGDVQKQSEPTFGTTCALALCGDGRRAFLRSA